MESATKNIMAVQHLAVGYGSSIVAKNINFRLSQGELCAIVGANGIGKSTLLKTLGKLHPKISGSIAIYGRELKAYESSKLSKTLGMVLTEPIATKTLTVSELIALGRYPYTNWLGTLKERDKMEVEKSLQIFHLKDLSDKKCHQLSDGQLQRTLIARALAQNTDIILLDEPTTHLDLYHKVQILKTLRNLAQRQGKTLVYTTHEIGLAIQLCDSILILDGNTNPFGKPCELIEQKHFEHLFPSETVRFDAKTGSFKVNK